MFQAEIDITTKVSDFQTSLNDLSTSLNSLKSDRRVWSKLGRQIEEGETVFPPQPKSKKRVHSASQSKECKKPLFDENNPASHERSPTGIVSDGDNTESDEIVKIEPKGEDQASQSLTNEQIDSKQSQLDDNISVISEQVRNIKEQFYQLVLEKGDRELKKSQHEARFKSLCIQERNNYTRVDLTRDFQTVGYVHVGSEIFIRAGAH
jgi:hypothetical protein